MEKSNILEEYKLKRKKTTDEFVTTAISVHGNKYNYSLVDYKHSKKNIDIVCPIHGVFGQRPDVHLKGRGCNKCSITYRSKTTNEFINEAKEIHKDKYDYSLVEYKQTNKKIKIICKEHGEFSQLPSLHLNGSGCPKCIGRYKTTESIISEFKEVHNNKYDYSLVKYKKAKDKIIIICKKHGEFEQRAISHLMGNGCAFCYGNVKYNINYVINKANKIHSFKYDYSLVEYKNSDTKIKIICPIHHIFEQTPYQHINRENGCPKCKQSKGEVNVMRFLDNYDITYNYQHKFPDCKYIKPLSFDFYLPDYNMCVEFDGEQHTALYNFEKTDDKLKLRQKRDSIKNEYCLKNNINLLRINYNENINEKLITNLNL